MTKLISDYETEYDYDYCVQCGCDLTHRDDGDNTCCWCLERIQAEKDKEEQNGLSIKRKILSQHSFKLI